MSLNFLLGFTGVLSFGHAAYFGLGAYGAGFALKFLAPSTPLALLAGMLLGGICRRAARRADRAPARRLFRHGDDRLRPGVLLHRLPVELGDRRRRRLARLLAPAARFRRRSSIDILIERQHLLLFRAVLLRDRGRRDGLHPALAVRPHDARDPRERAPRALSRHPDRAAYLDRVHALLLLHGLCRRALCAAQQFRRSARPALQPVRRLRDHGGDGRHAQLLGAAARRRRLRRAAGLSLERHGQLDVLRRPVVRAGRAVLPARPARLSCGGRAQS